MNAPSSLLTDLLAFPENGVIATRQPTFGWTLSAGLPQAAFQLQILSQNETVWDSGRVDSPETLHHTGPELEWDRPYQWRVRVWADEGEGSPWAVSAIWQPTRGQEAVSHYRLETVRLRPERLVFDEARQCWFADFGRHAFGWLEVTLPGSGVCRVHVGEKLDGEGVIDRQPPGTVRYLEAEVPYAAGVPSRVTWPSDERNTGSAAILLPAEIGVIAPFRYVEIDAPRDREPVLEMVRVQYPFDESAATFKSSDETLNAIWDLCQYSILATSFAGYYVDGDRERIPYEADAYINQLSHYACDREFSLARRTQEYLLQHPTWPTEWKQFSIMIAWADYEATGDLRSLERTYEVLRDEKLLLKHAREDGLLDTTGLRDIVDWPGCERDEYDFRPVNTVVNAFHYLTLRQMSAMAKALGREVEAADFAQRATRVYAAFQKVLFDPTRGVYVDGEGSEHASQHAGAFALAFDLVPLEHQKSVVAWVRSRGIAVSVYAVQFLLEGYLRVGAVDAAYEVLLATGLRSWRNMLDQGATITWEAWDQSFKPNQDWNHAWGSAPINIAARYLLGVQPLEPGYGRVAIRPTLGPLRELRGRVPTIRGPIEVHVWRDAETGEQREEVTLPPGVIRE